MSLQNRLANFFKGYRQRRRLSARGKNLLTSDTRRVLASLFSHEMRDGRLIELSYHEAASASHRYALFFKMRGTRSERPSPKGVHAD